MRVTAVTVSVGVRDLDRAVAWYQAALDLGEPDVRPADGLVEFDLGSFWLQLAEAPDRAGVRGVGVNVSVGDVRELRARLSAAGLVVSEVERFDGAVDFCELTDPDGNTIGFVTELA
jgi:catechol 2,3-dioxygenase-like lactoylglutathione lyase family enzyme